MNIYEMMVVNIGEIDIEKKIFKISKNIYSLDLDKSIIESGLLETPFLVRDGDGYYPLTCHNRLSLCKKHKIETIRAFILNEPDVEIFLKNLTLKTFRKEIGPIGKIRAVQILQNYFKYDNSDAVIFFKSVLAMPDYLYRNKSDIDTVLSFPDNLKNYIDSKDLPFKTIRDLIVFTPEEIRLIDYWIGTMPVRVNIFKKLIDYIFDILKRDGSNCLLEIGGIKFKSDRELLDHVFRIRYPDYSVKRERLFSIIEEISSGNVSIEFPEYFERDIFFVKIDIGKKNNPKNISDAFAKIDIKKLIELQKFL